MVVMKIEAVGDNSVVHFDYVLTWDVAEPIEDIPSGSVESPSDVKPSIVQKPSGEIPRLVPTK